MRPGRRSPAISSLLITGHFLSSLRLSYAWFATTSVANHLRCKDGQIISFKQGSILQKLAVCCSRSMSSLLLRLQVNINVFETEVIGAVLILFTLLSKHTPRYSLLFCKTKPACLCKCGVIRYTHTTHLSIKYITVICVL